MKQIREGIARAICHQFRCVVVQSYKHDPTWCGCDNTHYLEEADAVLEYLRSPEMAKIFAATYLRRCTTEYGGQNFEEVIAIVWRDMFGSPEKEKDGG